MKAMISDIKRLAVHDGPGIRTTVFFTGCPLKCLWCHNPESIGTKPRLAFYESKCAGCTECVQACPSGAHQNADGSHRFDRALCIGCGKCEPVCAGDALKLYGTQMTVEDLLPLLLEDRDFYATTGGVTLSGGECLMQADFCAALLKELKKAGIHTAVDTCGFVSRSAFERVLPHTDLFLYDLKAMDPAVHKRCTGQENGIILENLRYLDSLHKDIEIRIPFVPGHNDGEMESIRAFLGTLSHVTEVKLLPYHNYAGSKYAALGMENTLPPALPTDMQLDKAREVLYG